MWKYACLISYEGTEFQGWQRQDTKKPSPTIQASVEAAVKKITGESPSVVGSGRTDAGVHAVGQVAHFVLKKKNWNPNTLKNGMNSFGILPQSIRILDVQAVDISFHAQKSAVKKQYSYYFQQGPSPLPHLEPYSWWIRKPLDVQAMSQALKTLRGKKEFKVFQASGSKKGSTVREILETEVSLVPIQFPTLESKDFHLVRMRIVGTGFLKQMVRGIAGTLVQVGEGKREPSCFEEILSSGKRASLGMTAPARALWLEWVTYPDAFSLQWPRGMNTN
jgi:tRNA pseudouridine38-40 synthase